MESIIQKVLRFADESGFDEIVAVSPDLVRFSKDVFDQCKRNTCGKYGANYACPPKSGSLKECMAKLRACDYVLVAGKLTSMKRASEMGEGMRAFAESVESLRGALERAGVDATVYSAGPCTICPECAAITGEPCRFPEKRHYSMEGSGVDVMRTAMDLGMTYNAGPGTMTYFAMVGHKM
jgi:predicted metal-binding protein